MKHDIPKHRAQYLHFKSRLYERYGMRINRTRYRELCSCVGPGHTRVLEKQSRRVWILLMEIDGVRVPVVWDRYRGRLVSALPPGSEAEFSV